ncbi:MAG: hypothetical protein Q8O84_04075 [Nanoarchaeota archaeon]|nr:hypothetical protein [Nanoarchaeota archaeon]
MEKYYLVERVKDCFWFDMLNINLVKQTKKGLEALSSNARKLEEIRIKLNNGKLFCADNKYQINEINKKESSKILRKIEESYSLPLQRDYLSISENFLSSHLSGLGGKRLK